MADVIVFHHAQGLTPGVADFADRLRTQGHSVTVPDLYDGRTFDDLDDGVAYAQQIEFDAIIERGRIAAAALPAELVYIGFSLGVLPAQQLAQTRPGARGAVLAHSCIPTAEFGGPWPTGVPVQIHGMDHDEWFVAEGDLDAAHELVASSDAAELFLYPGDGHLFVDSSLPAYDAEAAELFTGRALTLLGSA